MGVPLGGASAFDQMLERLAAKCRADGGRLVIAAEPGGGWSAELDPGPRKRKLSAPGVTMEEALRALEALPKFPR